MTHLFAPGKLVLMGEYSVLDGGNAIVAAVNHGVSVTTTPSNVLRIDTPSDDRFVRPALIAASAPNAHYIFKNTSPINVRGKLGVGGSAAATVAAIAAAWSLNDRPLNARKLADLARTVHKSVQGSGSGIDVLASVWGGITHITDDTPHPIDAVLPMVIWSGNSAKTGPRVQQYRQLSEPIRAAFVRDSNAIVREYSTHPINALNDNGDLIHVIATTAGITYLTPALSAIIALAQSVGGGAKPSGAGGGDCAIALFPCQESRLEFTRLLPTVTGARVIATTTSPGIARR